MATKLQEILLKGNTTNASAVPSSLKVREIAINTLDRSLFTNDGNSIVKLYTGTTKWFDVNGNANNALKLGGVLASEYINKEAFNSHINNSTIHITATERTAWDNKWDYNEETIKNVKVNAAISADKATKLQDDTSYTAWGQTFFENGKPKNVSGDLNVGISKIYWLNDANNYSIGIKNDGHAYYKAFYGHHFYAIGVEILTIAPSGNVLVNGSERVYGDLIVDGEVVAVAGEGTPAGVTDYSALTGKPQINGVTLVSGNNTLASLGIQAAGDYATNSGVATLLANYADKTFVSNNYVGKAAFNSHIADSDIHITAAERVAWNAKWNYDEATIKEVKVNSASSADSVAWSGISGKPSTFTPSAHTHTASEVSGLPTKLSAFTNDVGFITGITKSMVEGVLTGNITSHTHSYLPLSGGTITGRLVCDYKLSNSSNYTWRNSRQHSGEGSRADSFIVLLKADGTFNASFSTFGNDETDSYIYIGYKKYNDLNLRIGATSISWGDNPILHSGNFNSYAPTLTGTGASGTWGISISGNAASADYASSAGLLKMVANQNPDTSSIGQIFATSHNEGIPTGGDAYLSGITLASNNDANYKVQLGLDFYGKVFSRWQAAGTWRDWNRLAFITDNVASATKLQTPRTLWGQSFDGTGNVDGGITIRRTWDVGLYTEGIRVVGASNEWCGVFLGTADTTSGYQDSQWNITKTDIDTLRISRGPSYLSFLEIKPNGNVLIGTATDNGYKLQVNGSERVYGDLIVDGEVSALVA